MKRILVVCLIASIVYAKESEDKEDATQKYRNKKAHEATIHDAYYEAKRYQGELPAAWKDTLTKFGYTQEEINFYTAVRMNKFTERVGNNIIILRPNFFLYLTDAEQAAYIGLKLASLQADEEFDVGGSHETFYKPKISEFQKWSVATVTLGLAALYHEQIAAKSKAIGSVIFSKGAALIAGVLAVNGTKKLLEEHEEIKKLRAAQCSVIDKIGPDGILSIREKQVHWGYRNHSWLVNKWYYVLGKLGLQYNPESDLEMIKEYIAQKAAQK